MMTFEEQIKRLASVQKLSLVALHERMTKWRIIDKLNAYNTLLEPPAVISASNKAQVKRLREEMDALRDMEEKLNKISDKLTALPSWSTVDYFDGSQGLIVHEGMLPDFSPTSKDETEALKMLADYYARESA